MFASIVVCDFGAERAGDDDSLCDGVRDRERKVKVGVSSALVDPHVPEDRRQTADVDQRVDDDELELDAREEVQEEGQQQQENGGRGESGKRMKDRQQSVEHPAEEERTMLKLDEERHRVQQEMYMYEEAKEGQKVIKHLGEQIPHQASVRAQLTVHGGHHKVAGTHPTASEEKQ